MNILRAHIFGFGHWVDTTIDFPAGPFLCIYGENESGKSTLRQFILFMLFGFPPKKRAFYYPKSSSRMGGRLTVIDEKYGEFTIERMDQVRNGAATCELANGDTHDEAWLKQRMNGMTLSTYEAIFSFSALDLTQIKSMKEADLGDVLLGIGLTGASSIYDIEKKLENQMGDLFKPTGKKPHINQQLQALEEHAQKMSEHRQFEETYRDKIQHLNQLNEDISNIQTELKTKEATRRFKEKQFNALSLLHDYDHCQRELARYPEDVSFPENGIVRFEKLQDQRLPLKGEWAVLQDTEATIKQTITELKQRQHTEDVFNQVNDLIEQLQKNRERSYQIQTLDNTLDKLNREQQSALNALNIGLQQDALATIFLPFSIEKAWQHLKHTQEQLDLDMMRLKDQYATLTRERDELLIEARRLNSQLLDEQTANDVRRKLYEDDEEHTRQKLAEQRDKQHTTWQRLKKQREKRLTVTMTVAIALAILSGVAGFILSNEALLIVAAVSIMFGISQFIIGKRSIKDMVSMFATQDDHTDVIKLNETERDKLSAQLAIHDQATQDLQAIDKQTRTVNLRLMRCEDDFHGLEVKKDQLAKDIEDHIKTHPYLADVDVIYWPDLFQSLRHLVRRQEEISHFINERRHLQSERDVVVEQVRDFYHQQGMEYPETEVLESLTRLLEEQRNIQSQLMTYQQSLDDNHQAQLTVQRQIQTYENEMMHLFDQAHAKDENEFWQRADVYEAVNQLKEQSSKIEEQLISRFSEQDYTYMVKEANRDGGVLKQKLEQLDIAREELETSLEAKRSEYARHVAELDRMESDTDFSMLQHRFNMEVDALHKEAKKWAVLKTAKSVLEEAKRTFREKYMDKVMEQAAQYFALLTDERYSQIHPPHEQSGFRVEREDGVRFSVNELSQGTVDQLYIALRLGIGRIMSEAHRVPYMIDDAFVHFDDDRTKRMLSILETQSTDQQMIVLTCKKNIVQTVEKDKTVFLGESVRINASLVIK
ncbi:ATP-binding protein [Lentibacillus saliphilus]|uniref:ATP-binding protein n=1 Tax=Lentibacillus saliphilus TaxID=2737028 RepID=UPI001C3033A4|nr:AAA family ATPase [Lentibacillus saliphilus]